jgi:hypothetical protein
MNEDAFQKLSKYVHDARKPLNRISMQAELIKMALNGDVPAEKALVSLDKIIASTKDCSATLSELTAEFSNTHVE